MKNLLTLLLLSLAFSATEALAQKAQSPFTSPPVEVFLSADLESLPSVGEAAQVICSGFVTIKRPSLEDCPPAPPRYADYVGVGVATCWQSYAIPKTWKLVETDRGATLRCKLDGANAEPTGDRECDYSDCFYVREPGDPWPGVALDELGR